MEIIGKLGIDWRLLIAQIVNFAILLLVLRRFAYRPMIQFLEQRTERIEKGLRDADEAKKRLDEATVKEAGMLRRAKAEAKAILEKAQEAGKKNQEALLADAKIQAAQLIASAEKKMESEKARLVAEAKAEIAETVVLAAEKILGEKLHAENDAELIQKSLKEVH